MPSAQNNRETKMMNLFEAKTNQPATRTLQARHHAIAAAIGCFAFPVLAMDFQLSDDVKLKFNSTVTFGTTLRTESPDPSAYGTLSAARVGLVPGQLGSNSGSSNLNFQGGAPVSTVLKGVADFELTRKNMGLFMRVKAWNDFELKNGSRAYGNTPNGFARNVPLSDNGFDSAATFSNAQLADVYVFGNVPLGDTSSVDVRLGRQVINWGGAKLFAGGVSAISPVDAPASQRPGALPQEGKVPVGMLAFSLKNTKEWGLEGFAPYEFRPNVLPGCGTFFAANNYAPTGCGYVSVLGGAPFSFDDPTALANGRYLHRRDDVPTSNSGQFGLSVRYSAAAINTDFRGYMVNYHSPTLSTRTYNPNIAGGYGLQTTTRLTDPNGLAYAAIYPENIQLFAASFETKVNASSVIYGELAYRPNQPITLNATDSISAALSRSPTSALNLAKGTNAIPPGGTFDNYDRFAVTNLSLGITQVFDKAMGASRVTVTGELGWSNVAGLPDPGVLRYGRAEDFGGAAVNGFPCTDTTVAQKACARDGFVSTDAWGYRIRAVATYPGAFFGGTLTPSITFAHDVRGYSYDGSLNQGRMTLRPAIRAEWSKKYFTDIQYTMISGGTYNSRTDRDTLALAVGMTF